MLFNSYAFLFLFLPVVLLVYWRLPPSTSRKVWSVAASYFFYGVWSWKFAVLMFLTTSVDFFTALQIEASQREERRKFWLGLSILANLSVLGFFKYYNFFSESLHHLLPMLSMPALQVMLPLGISFYTFESMSYTIDVYRRETIPARRFIDYAHFIAMFPRLVAGPIVRYSQVVQQLKTIPTTLTHERAIEALHFFTLGLAKKVLVADTLAEHLVNPLFGQATGSLQAVSGWMAALGYGVQLYFDFSGYSDMAVGLGLLLGFQFPRNFNLPFRAANAAEFWRRWHISLSSWLRDYVYIPLGGGRKGPARAGINVALTMLIGGLWHGANWTFVAWGAYHGIVLLLYRALRQYQKQSSFSFQLPRRVAIGGTFLTLTLSVVLFRSATVQEAWRIYLAIFGFHGLGLSWVSTHTKQILLLAPAVLISFTVDTYDWRPPLKRRWAVLHGLLLAVCITRLSAPSPFLYFQF